MGCEVGSVGLDENTVTRHFAGGALQLCHERDETGERYVPTGVEARAQEILSSRKAMQHPVHPAGVALDGPGRIFVRLPGVHDNRQRDPLGEIEVRDKVVDLHRTRRVVVEKIQPRLPDRYDARILRETLHFVDQSPGRIAGLVGVEAGGRPDALFAVGDRDRLSRIFGIGGNGDHLPDALVPGTREHVVAVLVEPRGREVEMGVEENRLAHPVECAAARALFLRPLSSISNNTGEATKIDE